MADTNITLDSGSPHRVALDLSARLVTALDDGLKGKARVEAVLSLYAQCLNVVRGGDADVSAIKGLR